MKQIDIIKLKKNAGTAGRQALISVSAVVISLLLSMLIIAMMDINPITALKQMFIGALGTKKAWAETIVKMTPLLFTGMSYALANRCGLTNLGMEGQLYMGALGATAVGIYVKGLPMMIHLPLAMLAGFAAGAIWGFIPGFLKVRSGASEIITTVMMNTIATEFVAYMVAGPMIEPPGKNIQTPAVLETAQLPQLFGGSLRAHWGFIVALVFVILFWLFLWKSKKGYEVRVSGQNMRAAIYSGIKTKQNIMLVMLLAGGIAGLAGASEILGVQDRLVPTISPGYGFDGVAVALIGMNTPIGIVIGSFLFGLLRAGGNMMQAIAKVPAAIISVIQAFVIISIVASNMLLEKWNDSQLKKRQKQEA